MRNERGSKRTGRSGAPSRQGKSTSSSSAKRKPAGPKKFTKTSGDTGGYKKSAGPKKFGTGFKKEGDKKWEDRKESGSSSKPAFKKKYDSDRKTTDSSSNSRRDKKPFAKKSFDDKDTPKGEKRFTSKGPYKKKFGDDKAPVNDGEKKFTKKPGSYKDYKSKGTGSSFAERKEYKKKTGIKTYTDKNDPERVYTKETEIVKGKNSNKSFKKVKVYQGTDKDSDGSVRLNKFIANAGICSRREADTYIETGVVTVNGVIITELGYKVKPGDRVLFHDKPIIGEKHVYILLNKPKDYITTSKDPQNRKTVLELISGIKERVFPVGRLDRNTTGVLLLTNDGALAEKLMHPRKGVAKIYHVELDKKFTGPDLEKIRTGLELEDGFFTPDEVDYAEGMDKHHVGIEIHSGANRIVRRLFESLNYNVIKLDRVVYAGLTKKGLTRGKWRFLKDSEVNALKMM
jgi:23S rRNA pseudouridine2605 synthase